MKRIHLTSEEKADLECRHTQCHNRKEGDRIKAVLLRSEGWTVPMISQALRLNTSTVTRHLNDYRENKLNNSSGGSESVLSETQTEALIAHLEEHTYHYVHEIIQYVEKHFSVTYSVPGMNKWLHRNNFSYKKPKGVPYKANKEQQEQFIESYNSLKETLNAEDSIYFGDSVHPTQATKLSDGWIRKGTNKPIETTASRTRLNIIGAMKLDDIGSTVSAKYDIINNPIERLWKVMNEQVRNNRFFKSAKDFKQSIDDFFKNILPKIGSSLGQRINDNFQSL